MSRAYAINAVVVSDDGKNIVQYKGQCPKCGAIGNTTYTTQVLTGCTSHRAASCRCFKCMTDYDVTLGRG